MSTLPRRAASALLLLCCLSPARSALGQVADRSGLDWSLVRIDIDVSIDPEGKQLELAGVLRVRSNAEASFGPTIGINKEKPILRFVEVASGDAQVELNALLDASPGTRLAHVRLTQAKRRGDEIDVTFRCVSEGRSYQFLVDERIALASWVEGWYPVPLPKSFTHATIATPGRMRFLVPEGWTAVSNGRRTANAAGEVVWEASEPLARSFIAGPFQEASCATETREIGVFLLKPKPYAAAEQARTLAAAIGAMEKRFGRYPFTSYAIAEVPQDSVDWYASSEQGFIMAKTEAFDVADGNLPLFAHEAAHGWWGNRVSAEGPGSILCSESLAQYGAVVAIEDIEGADAATEFLRFSRAGYNSVQCARGYFGMWRQGKDKPLAELTGGGFEHNLSDAKGHWMFHMLRGRIGDARFFGVLRGLVEAQDLGPITLDVLRARFVAAAPDERLERFFSQWLDRGGAPVLEETWSDASDATGSRVRLVIEQRGEPYDLDLEVEVVGSEGARLHSIAVREARGEWSLASPGAPREVRLDPRHRLLIWKPEYGAKPARDG